MSDIRPGLMPKARKDRLIVKELPNETLIYDQDNDKAHCLNHAASIVWKNCDGEQSISTISARLTEESGAPVEEGVVWLALADLGKFNLLSDVPNTPPVFAAVSRRQLIRTAGVVAIALPVIMTLAAPPAHAQASCIVGNNTPCTVGGTPCCAPRTCLPHPSGSTRCQ